MFIEMSRDETHGGGAWSFKKCVWAPTRNQKGGRWPFWEKILSVRIGDTVLHLRGIGENAQLGSLVLLDALTYDPFLAFYGVQAAGHLVGGAAQAIAHVPGALANVPGAVGGLAEAAGEVASSVFETIAEIIGGLFSG